MRTVAIALLAAALLAGCAGTRERVAAVDTEADEARALVDAAIEAAGGRAALERSPVLAWSGHANVHLREQRIPIGVDTIIRPDGRSESKSWRAEQGAAQARVMTITPDGGTVAKVGGPAEPLPEGIAEHERAQYALYQVARLVPLDGAALTLLPRDANGRAGVRAVSPSLPEVELRFDGSGRLAEIHNGIGAPDEPQRRVAQVLRFDGTVESNGVRWFRVLEITWDGEPYFDLSIDRFEARAR